MPRLDLAPLLRALYGPGAGPHCSQRDPVDMLQLTEPVGTMERQPQGLIAQGCPQEAWQPGTM